jgi:hypothetical protein
MDRGKLYDELASKTRKTVTLELRGCMGGGTNGPREFKAGRKSKPRRWSGGVRGSFTRERIMVVRTDETRRRGTMAAYHLYKDTYEDGAVEVGASVGDMALTIETMGA